MGVKRMRLAIGVALTVLAVYTHVPSFAQNETPTMATPSVVENTTPPPRVTQTPRSTMEIEDVNCFRADGGHDVLEGQIEEIMEVPIVSSVTLVFPQEATDTDKNGNSSSGDGISLVMVLLEVAGREATIAYGVVATNFTGASMIADFRGNENKVGVCESEVLTIIEYEEKEIIYSAEEGAAASRPTPKETATPRAERIVNPGTYLVGEEIAPGLYKGENEKSCYWKRLKDFKGGHESELGGNYSTRTAAGQYYAEVLASDFAVTFSCPVVAYVETKAGKLRSEEVVKPGTYIVGKEIDPGIYEGQVPENGGPCYWERLRDFKGEFASLIANELLHGGRFFAEVADSDYAVMFTCSVKKLDEELPTSRSTVPTILLAKLATPRAERIVNPGTYLVGEEIAPGLYKGENEKSCYWKRLKDFKGGHESELGGNYSTRTAAGQYYAEVLATDYAVTFSCPVVAYVETKTYKLRSEEVVKPGTYIVGKEIDSGIYEGQVPENGGPCYWERLRDFKGEFASLISNELFRGGRFFAEVADSDYAVMFTCPLERVQ